MRVVRAEQLTRSVREGSADLESHCTYAALCSIAGVTVELRTDVPDVARAYAQRYADHPAPGAADFRFFVATVRGGYTFWCAHAATWRWTQGPLPADAIAFLADAVILNAIVRFDPAVTSMRASAIEFDGVAAALSGGTASDRAAAILACARRGMRVYSDERAIMRDGVVYPFLRRCSTAAAGTRMLLAETDAPEMSSMRGTAPELSLKTCFGAESIAPPAPLRALFVIGGTGHCAVLEAIDTATALPAVARWFDSQGDMVDRIARAIGLLQGVQSYRLTLGEPDETASGIAYALRRLAND